MSDNVFHFPRFKTPMIDYLVTIEIGTAKIKVSMTAENAAAAISEAVKGLPDSGLPLRITANRK